MPLCEPCGKYIPDYQWSAHESGRKHAEASAHFDPNAPKCHCTPASSCVTKVCQKENENKGREFYVCRKGSKQYGGCGMFQWADAPALEVATSNTSFPTACSCKFQLKLRDQQQQDQQTPAKEEKASIPSHINLSDLKVTVKLVGSKAELKFKFNRDFIDQFKQHVPGRQWEPSRKIWTCPKSSLPDLVQLFKDLSIKVPSNIQQAAVMVKTAVVLDPNVVELILEPAGSAIAASFAYNPILVGVIKKLHPSLRQFDFNQHKWALDVSCLDQLQELFEEDEDIVDVKKTPTPASLELLKSRLRPKLSQTSSNEENIDNGQGSSKYQKSETGDKISTGSHHPNCICGESYRDRPFEKHVCRLFGLLQCSNCDNEWSTAYCWYYPETDTCDPQECRRCGSEGVVVDKRPRNKNGGGGRRFGENTHGAHDCSRCSRCQKLGRDCSGGRGSWSGGFSVF